MLWGEKGDDRLFGNGGDDWLWGGLGHNLLIGGLGHDTLDGTPEQEAVSRGPGTMPAWLGTSSTCKLAAIASGPR